MKEFTPYYIMGKEEFMPFLTIKENGQSLVKSAFKVSLEGKTGKMLFFQ